MSYPDDLFRADFREDIEHKPATWQGGDPVADIKRAAREMRENPYIIPPPPVPHPLTQLRMVASDVALKQWDWVWAYASVSGQAQVVLAPDRVLICWPDRTVGEVWLHG